MPPQMLLEGGGGGRCSWEGAPHRGSYEKEKSPCQGRTLQMQRGVRRKKKQHDNKPRQPFAAQSNQFVVCIYCPTDGSEQDKVVMLIWLQMEKN